MKRPYVNFRELKAAVPISRVLERYGVLESLSPKGEGLSGPCPFCEGETSFRANLDKSCFHCFGCKAGGNMLDFVAAKEECSIRDAAIKVAEWFGVETSKAARGGSGGPSRRRIEVPSAKTSGVPACEAASSEAQNAQEAQVLDESPAPAMGDAAPHPEEPPPVANRPLTFELKLDADHPWFAEVGLSPETVREFGLGFCSKGVMAGRIAFPIRNAGGELVGYAGIWPDDALPDGQPLWKYPKGLDLTKVVYPAERLGDTPPGHALFASDPLRVALCWQLGVQGVFFVPGGLGIEECSAAINRSRGG